MHIPEYTISPKLHDALQHAFEPFLHEQVDGVALSDWLKERHASPLPLELRVRLGATLDTVLALDGGQQGIEIREAMDGIINSGGAPAILMHGLPTTTASSMIHEAFRQALFADTAHGNVAPQYVRDLRAIDAPSGYKKTGKKYFHQDLGDTVIIAGIRGGGNPRHTVFADAPEFLDYILSKLPQSSLGDTDPHILAQQCFELLQLPIWPIENVNTSARGLLRLNPAAELLAVHAQKAEKLHQVRTPIAQPVTTVPTHSNDGILARLFKRKRDDKKTHGATAVIESAQAGILSEPGVSSYAPIIYPNPDFHPDEPGSVPYRFFKAPFAYLYERMPPEMSLVPAQLKPAADLFVEALYQMRTNDVSIKAGPILDAGDMLIFNNRLMVHAGGPYKYDALEEEPPVGAPREIVAMDVFSPDDYPIRPGDRIAKPIRMGTFGPEIDPLLNR